MVYINYISGLATQNPATDNEVYVQAYSVFGDGGYFVWRTNSELPPGYETSEAGIWFTGGVTGGLWERQFSGREINVRWFGAKGDNATDDTLAFNNCFLFASKFGYGVFVPKGNYLLDSVSLLSNIAVNGEGDLSILQLKQDATNFIFFIDQSGSSNITNVRISNLHFYYPIASFSEHKHFLSLSGISHFVIEQCFFEQFRGDAIYIGSGNSTSCHNDNIIICNCRFDGVGQTNRNAITIIDGTQVLIKNNNFKNTTESTMPGAIDIEPNGTGNEILKDIIVQGNYFYNIGGGSSCCSVYLPPNAFTVNPTGFYFLNNYLEQVNNGFQFVYRYQSDQDTKPKNSLFIENNIVINAVYHAFALYGACHAQVKGNYFNDGYGGFIGYTTQNTETCQDVIVQDNLFDKCGNSNGNGISIFNCKRITLSQNTFNDCGTGTAGAANAIDFDSRSSSDYIFFQENIFLTPTSKTLVAIQKEPTHTFTNPRHNRFFNNQLNGLASSFLYINDNNFGLATIASPGSSVTIAHSLGTIPKWATVQPQTGNVAGIKNITVDATNITVYFTTTPSGSVNLFWSVQA